MNDNDAFRLIDRDEAVFFGCIVVAMVAFAFKAEPAADPKPLPRCEASVAQYGPGERWVANPKQPTCVQLHQDAPNNFLTYPLEPQ